MPADIARRHCPQVLPTVRSLKVKLSSLALLKNFLVLLNNGMSISTIKSAKAEIFLCYSTGVDISSILYLQKQKFSCVTQLCGGYFLRLICKSRNFLVLLNDCCSMSIIIICKSRNFLVLLNFSTIRIFLTNLQKQKFSCVTQHLLRHYAQISTE